MVRPTGRAKKRSAFRRMQYSPIISFYQIDGISQQVGLIADNWRNETCGGRRFAFPHYVLNLSNVNS